MAQQISQDLATHSCGEIIENSFQWVHAGLPFKIHRVDDVISPIMNFVVNTPSTNGVQKQSRVRYFNKSQSNDYPEYIARLINHPINRSAKNGDPNKSKGISTCLKNCFGHTH